MTRRLGPRPLPLLDWADAHAKAIVRRRRLIRRAVIIAAGCALLIDTGFAPRRPLLIWNVSASAPVGLYLVRAPTGIEPGDMVAAKLAEPYAPLADQRRYLPLNVPMIKRVVAIDHDVVCADGGGVSVNGRWLAAGPLVDAKGRAMPSWQGCKPLSDGQVFLLMEEHLDSFDGRYFGVTDRQNIIGKVQLLWER